MSYQIFEKEANDICCHSFYGTAKVMEKRQERYKEMERMESVESELQN